MINAARTALSGSLLTLVALVAACAVALTACGGATDADEATAEGDGVFPVTIEHVFGETAIPERPERIVALGAGTDAEILYALGITPVGMVSFPDFGAANADGIMPWVESHYDAAETTLLPKGAEGVEAVLELDTDLILVTYGALEQQDYDRLSDIAPTVASPNGQWELDWRLQLSTVAEAVGEVERGRQLEQELTQGIHDAAQQHPELAGVSFSYLEMHQDGIWAYLSADPRNQLIAELGPVVSPGVKALDESTGGEFFADVSPERVADVDAELFFAYSSTTDAESVLTTPIFRDLPAVQAGHVAAYGADDAEFLASLQPSPLTIPLSVPRLAADLAAAQAN